MQNLPIITSPINITKIEVYITNKNSTTINTRNILAFQDLGEAQNISSSIVLVDPVVFPPYYPNNANNSLNPNGSFIEDVATDIFITPAPNCLAANSKEVRVRVESSKNKFIIFLLLNLLSLEVFFCLRIFSADNKILFISFMLRSLIDNKCLFFIIF